MREAICVENLSLSIKGKEILKSVSHSFERGQIHGLIGRNGSGKTMLMKCICGFVRPTGGKVTIEGKVIGKDCDFPENIGIIIENPDLLILDEPMNGLDKEGVNDMRRYLINLKEQGKTILIASHNSEDISTLCDTVCEMEKGILKNISNRVYLVKNGGKYYTDTEQNV